MTMRRLSIFVLSLLSLASFNACKEDIDESNLYTFTGETIEDFLLNNSEEFSSFNYILSRIGYDQILAAYGTYTCFAPRNAAVEAYVDSLYKDETNQNLLHNGMTQPGLEGLTDSLCKDIALFHLLGSEVMSVYMGNGMTVKTLLGRDINTSIDSVTTSVAVNRAAHISTDKDSFDLDMENGVLHVIDHVITRSNNLVAGEMEMHPELFTLFSQALKVTGLADSLTALNKASYESIEVKVENDNGFYVPERCEQGYTIMAETDAVLRAKGINSVEDLAAYAAEQYAHCADPGSGWYDYARNNNIQVSTGTDYLNPWNALGMFLRYHIIPSRLPYNKLVNDWNQTSKVMLVEYYETLLPYTLMKVTRNSNKLRLNYAVENSSLTNMVAELGTDDIHAVVFEGVELEGQNSQFAASNGYIHPITSMLIYDANVPRKALHERMRFDDSALMTEMMSNGFRRITDSEVKALNGGKEGTDGNLGGNYIRIPQGFFDNLEIYNGEDTRLYYLPGQSNNWSNYQGDEFNCKGYYDFAMRLPPVPDGTYELRLGYTANGNRGMLQFYLGRSKELITMQALDIPLDMRFVPEDNDDGSPDSRTGWCLWTKTEDQGVETDASMRNLGYMRGPLYYTIGKGGSTVARANREDLRRILARQHFEQGEYWLRFKNVIKSSSSQFHLDYIEFCPSDVYNSPTLVEDMF